MRSVAPSRTTTIAVSPAMRPMPSAAPVEMFGSTDGSRTRRIVAILVLPSAVGRLAHVRGDRLQPLARRRRRPSAARSATSSRRRSGTSARTPRRPAAVKDSEREDALLEERQAEDRDARCRACRRRSRCPTRPRAPATTGARTRRSRPRSATAIGVAITMPITVSRTVPRIGSRKPPESSTGRPRPAGCEAAASRLQVLHALDRHVDDDRRRRSRTARARRPSTARSAMRSPQRHVRSDSLTRRLRGAARRPQRLGARRDGHQTRIPYFFIGCLASQPAIDRKRLENSSSSANA